MRAVQFNPISFFEEAAMDWDEAGSAHRWAGEENDWMDEGEDVTNVSDANGRREGDDGEGFARGAVEDAAHNCEVDVVHVRWVRGGRCEDFSAASGAAVPPVAAAPFALFPPSG
uniref:Uncharacterized protein n=1 Tax=Globodera rostochiensis TaxID=31243 RepID=A0A914HZR6_GLORO